MQRQAIWAFLIFCSANTFVFAQGLSMIDMEEAKDSAIEWGHFWKGCKIEGPIRKIVLNHWKSKGASDLQFSELSNIFSIQANKSFGHYCSGEEFRDGMKKFKRVFGIEAPDANPEHTLWKLDYNEMIQHYRSKKSNKCIKYDGRDYCD